MALHPAGANPKSRPSAVFYNFEWPYLINGSSDPIRIWFLRKSTGENNARGVIRLVTIQNISCSSYFIIFLLLILSIAFKVFSPFDLR